MSDSPPRHRISRRGVLTAVPLLAAPAPLYASAAQPAPETLLSLTQWGIRGHNDPNDAAAIQRAFDEAPVGSELYFPPGEYRITKPLFLRRQLNLYGSGARIRAEFPDNSNLLTINVEDQVNRDNRLQRIRGLRLHYVGGGSTLALTGVEPNLANIGLLIENNLITGAGEGPGYAVKLEGYATQHLTLRNNQIENGVYLNTTDGIVISENVIFGWKPAITLDLHPGAFQTRIMRNSLVARDGALIILNGSQVYFEHNTIEQFPGYGPNRGSRSASLVIAPRTVGSRHIRLVSNNFGGGDNVAISILVDGDCQDLFIDHNVFNFTASGADIRLTGPAVAWTRIGPNNSLRASGRRRTQQQGREGKLEVEDRGTGTYGVRKPIVAAAGWRASPDASLEVSLDGQLRCWGEIGGGAARPGAVIAQLPVGARPARPVRALALSGDGIPVPLAIDEQGNVRLIGQGATTIDLTPLHLAVAPRPPLPDTDV